MKKRLWDALRPICPVCRTDAGQHPLKIAQVTRESDGAVWEGMLHCSNPSCQREFPVIDGIPLLIGAIRAYIADNLPVLLARSDLSPTTESLLADCSGPGSWFDTYRQQVSSYTWDHYADLDSEEAPSDPRPGSVLRLLDFVAPLLNDLPDGPLLDVGCGPGRTAIALAERYDRLVLGVELHAAMLRLAQSVLATGRVCYARRRLGVVYDRRDFAVSLAGCDRVDFWACDASAPPLPDRHFAAAVGLNVLDSVRSPIELLHSLRRMVQPGGLIVLACPYDWSSGVTPMEAWIGGHSQRSVTGGSAEPMLRTLLTPGAHPHSVSDVEILAEHDAFPWFVRLHDRSTMSYRLHVIVARVTEDKGNG